MFLQKVTSKVVFPFSFLDICHTNDKLPTFKINFKDEKSLMTLGVLALFVLIVYGQEKEICPLQCSVLQYGEFV